MDSTAPMPPAGWRMLSLHGPRAGMQHSAQRAHPTACTRVAIRQYLIKKDGGGKREMRKKKKHEGDDDEMFALPGKLPWQGRGNVSSTSKTRCRCPRNSLWKDVGQLRWVYSGGPCPEMPAVGALLGKHQDAVVTWTLQRGAARAGEEEGRKVWRPRSTPLALGSLSLFLPGRAGAT